MPSIYMVGRQSKGHIRVIEQGEYDTLIKRVKYVIMAFMSNGALQQELEFYKAHQKELLEKYEGKFLVIKDQKIQGAFASEIEAYTEAQKKLELGTFLIQQCLPGENSFTQTFHTRAIFK